MAWTPLPSGVAPAAPGALPVRSSSPAAFAQAESFDAQVVRRFFVAARFHVLAERKNAAGRSSDARAGRLVCCFAPVFVLRSFEVGSSASFRAVWLALPHYAASGSCHFFQSCFALGAVLQFFEEHSFVYVQVVNWLSYQCVVSGSRRLFAFRSSALYCCPHVALRPCSYS